MAKGPLVAIDIGQHTVKMLALKRTKAGAAVTGAASQAIGLSPQAPAEEIAQRVSEIIKTLRKNLSGGSIRAATALSGRTTFNRYVRIPVVSGRRLHKIVQYEARQQIPFPIHQVNFDHYIVPPPPQSTELEVMLLAVRKDVSGELVSRLKNGGIKTDIVEAGPVSLFNAYMATIGPAEEEVTAIINIGASATDIVVEQEGQLRFSRSAPFAGNNLTDLIAERLKVDWNEAESLKIRPASEYENIDGEGPTAVDVATILEEGFERIISDIRRSLDFHVSQPEASPVTRVLLCGGTARMEGAAEFLEDRLGVPVTLADFTTSETLDWSGSNKENYRGEGILAGLAVRCADKARIAVNIAPDQVIHRLELERRMPMLSLCGLVLLGMIFYSYIAVQQCIARDRQVLDRIGSVINPTGIGPHQKEIQALRAEQDNYMKRFDRLNQVAVKRGVVTNRYIEILSMVPEEVWLTTVSLASDKMTIQGKALNDLRLNEFLSNLRLCPYFDDTGVSLKNSLPSEDGSTDYTIEVNGAERFLNPTMEEVDFIRNLKKLLNMTIILARLEDMSGGGGFGMPGGFAMPGAGEVPGIPGIPGMPGAADSAESAPAESAAPVQVEKPKGPWRALVGIFQVDQAKEKLEILNKVYSAVQMSKVENCEAIQLRYFDPIFNPREQQEVKLEEIAAFAEGKRTEDEMLAVLEKSYQTPEPTPPPTPTPPPESEGGYGYGMYGYGYGMMGAPSGGGGEAEAGGEAAVDEGAI
ncbi:MAG TPA: type IV pilus assembly protein PilM [bacterium]|nr:type IV pilus assembly protein PilM [bacterium]